MKKSEATAYGGVPQNARKSIKMQKEAKTTVNDVLSAVNKLSTDIDKKLANQTTKILSKVDEKIKEVLDAVLETAELDEERFQKIEGSLGNIDNRLSKVETRLSTVETTINTQVVKKTDLEEAFATFEYKKVNKLTSLLQQKKILTPAEAKMVVAI